MKSRRGLWGFLFVGALGTLFHFTYEWLGEAWVAGLFFPVNESIWEHLKLLFFPVVLWWLIEWFFGERPAGFFPTRMKALVGALVLIPVAHYTYSGMIGQRFSAVDIGIFFLADWVYFWLVSRGGQKKEDSEGQTLGWLLVFLVLTFSFFVFSFYPPDLGIFWEP